MKHLYILLLFPMFLLGGLLLSSCDANNKAPQPKIKEFTDKYTMIPSEIELVRDQRLYNKYKASFDSLQETLRLNGQNEGQKLTIILSGIGDSLPVNEKQTAYLSRPEAYLLIVEPENISVMARDDQGVLNGLSALEALIEQYKGKLPQGWIVDYPDTKMRVLHISLWLCTIQDFKETIRLARFSHFNTLILLNHYGVDLQSLQHLEIKGATKWSSAEFQEMVRFTQENGLEVIPELKLLSHQDKLLSNSLPKYLYNKTTYDPRKKELYEKVVFPAIDELLMLTGATKFHIGHDEVAGWNKNHYIREILLKGEKQLPPELFLQDVLILSEYLKKKGIEAWMWGDMLVSQEEFPSMRDSGASLNGYNGYAGLRGKIPKDIVICDWHYRGKQVSFPTALAFAQNGHKVLGATWEFQETTRNFTKYMNHLSNNGEGMIATTWYGLSGEKKEEVQEIIRFSGEIFWNAK
jgi:hypothetical protein